VPNITAKAVDTAKPGASLAVWLAVHHPDLFLAAFKKAQAAQVAKGLGRLADDGVTTFFGDSGASPSDAGVQTITFDSSVISPPPSFVTDATDSGSGFLSSIGNGLTSAGSTVGGVLAAAGSGVLSALGSVGSYLTSASGLNSLTGLAKTYYGAQAASSTAQTQQAVLNAQIARAVTGQTAAPITYTTNAAGQLVPVVATQTPGGAVYQPLTGQTLASLTPSGLSVFLSKYGLWIALGVGGLIALNAARG
jgi:hypothetical protein